MKKRILLFVFSLVLLPQAVYARGVEIAPFLYLVRALLVIAGLSSLVYGLFSRKGSASWIFGLFCIVLYFGLGLYIGIGSAIPFVLFLLSGILFAVEFVVPGFGIAGISGIALMAYSLAASMGNPSVAAGTLGLSALVLFVLIRNLIERGEDIAFLEKLISPEKQYTQFPAACAVGDRGRSVSPLRPSGTAEIDGKRLSVQSVTGFVDANRPLEVVSVTGNQIYVKEV
ncbi:NfeD-like C-terminal, partner-binding [Aedoeadaptatus ivorii]|uniref:NfeD-like C-terminal, partner-binding n=1 Tax=Aedoeadaptatus ivorii TaxID=54006 RepID=A0A448V0W2_9FIRM|nr:NfeD family protein [Peptoniphilus ivorii]MDQ0507600.1 membrane-bound ClpP family serine protease [Peptoniphilus ivorii]VEJ35238.1 NfeD-like C-terminal, partner-binding [Peptoniphilus ivorii]